MTVILGTLCSEPIISIPQQQPLVCEDLFQEPTFMSVYGKWAQQTYQNYDQTYCHQLYEVVCWKNQTDTLTYPGYPPYVMQSSEGLFKGAGISFDVYKTDAASNSTYYRWPYEYGHSPFVDRSSLSSNGGLVITSHFEGLLMGDGSFFIEQYKLVLQYPWFSVMNTSGVDCSKTTFPVHKKDIITTTTQQLTTYTPLHTTPVKNSISTQQSTSSNAKGNPVMLGVILGTGMGCAVQGWAMFIYCSWHVWTRPPHHFQYLSTTE